MNIAPTWDTPQCAKLISFVTYLFPSGVLHAWLQSHRTKTLLRVRDRADKSKWRVVYRQWHVKIESNESFRGKEAFGTVSEKEPSEFVCFACAKRMRTARSLCLSWGCRKILLHGAKNTSYVAEGKTSGFWRSGEITPVRCDHRYWLQ